MLLCLYNRNSSAKLLKTGEADEAFKITEVRKYRHFLPGTLLRFGPNAIVLQECFQKISLKIFPKHSERLVLKEEVQSALGKTTLYSRTLSEIAIQRSSRAQK